MQRMAQRAAPPQGLGALQQPKRMQAGGIVAFQEGKNVVGSPKTQEEQIQYLIDQGLTDEQIRAEVKKLGLLPQAADQIIQKVRNKRLATAPPGMMEEVVVTAPRLPQAPVVNPLSAEAMIEKQREVDQTKDKNVAEIPVPKEITPKKKTYSKPEGVVETLFGEQGAILPLGLEKESGIRDRVQYAIDTNKPLTNFSVEELKALQSDDNQYTPKIEAELARRQPQPKQGIAAVAEETTSAPQVRPPQGPTGGIAAVAEPEIPSAENALALRSQGNQQGDGQGIVETTPQSTDTAPSSEPKAFDLQTRLDDLGDAPAPAKVDRTGLEKRGVDFTKAYGVDPASIDAKAEGLAALQSAEDYYGIKDKDTEARQGLADLAAIDAAQTDPDKLRRERMKAFLLGAAGRGSTALAASGAASANLGRAQERDVRARQIKRNEMLKQIQNQDTEVRKLAKSEERSAMERADQLKMDGLRIISNMSNAELSARQTEANAINETNIANYKGKIERVQLLLEQSNAAIDQAIAQAQLASLDASRRGQIANAGIDDALRRKTEIGKILEQTYRDQLSADQTLLNLNSRLSDPDLSDADRQGISDEIRRRQVEIKANLALANKAQYDEIDQLDQKILQLENARNSILGGGISDIAVSTQEQSLVDQYK
jgi:hypothetical protein